MATNRFESNLFSASSSDSGVFMLDPKDRAMIEAAAEGLDADTEEVQHAKWVELARRLPKVRLEKVMKIREEIAAGTYVTDEKLNGTIDRLLNAMRGR